MGGKLLSKLLSKMVSFKQLKMDDYIQSVTKMKEQVCFVAQTFKDSEKLAKASRTYYVLPDPDIGRQGYMTQERDQTGVLQMLSLSKERYIVPETLFTPQM